MQRYIYKGTWHGDAILLSSEAPRSKCDDDIYEDHFHDAPANRHQTTSDPCGPLFAQPSIQGERQESASVTLGSLTSTRTRRLL
jgi:hypothetical protein